MLPLIQSSVEGTLGSFHDLAIVDKAAMNIGVHMALPSLSLYLWGKYTVVQWLDHRVAQFLPFKGTSTLFSRVVVPTCLPANNVGGIPILHILSSNCCFLPSQFLAF